MNPVKRVRTAIFLLLAATFPAAAQEATPAAATEAAAADGDAPPAETDTLPAAQATQDRVATAVLTRARVLSERKVARRSTIPRTRTCSSRDFQHLSLLDDFIPIRRSWGKQLQPQTLLDSWVEPMP